MKNLMLSDVIPTDVILVEPLIASKMEQTFSMRRHEIVGRWSSGALFTERQVS